jgi:hypothetical protein
MPRNRSGAPGAVSSIQASPGAGDEPARRPIHAASSTCGSSFSSSAHAWSQAPGAPSGTRTTTRCGRARDGSGAATAKGPRFAKRRRATCAARSNDKMPRGVRHLETIARSWAPVLAQHARLLPVVRADLQGSARKEGFRTHHEVLRASRAAPAPGSRRSQGRCLRLRSHWGARERTGSMRQR